METYKEFVIKGKELVSKINELKELERCYQAKIAKYALAVCDVRHGGYSKGLYTLKDYAIDIGLNPKTVQNWAAIYRNVIDKLGLEDPTIEEWRRACKTDRVLKLDRIIDNKNEGKSGTLTAYKRTIPKEDVQNIFDGIDEKPFVGECHSITGTMKHVKHKLRANIENLNNITDYDMNSMEDSSQYTHDVLGKRDLGIVDDKRLLHLMEVLDDASEIINEFLTIKKRKERVA